VALKSTISVCPKCGSELAILMLVQHVTPAGIPLGADFVKCRGGCSKADIVGYRAKRPWTMPEKQFLRMLFHARGVGAEISRKDLDREAAIYQRLINQRKDG